MHLNQDLMRRVISTRASSWFMAGVAFHWHINLAVGVEGLAEVSYSQRYRSLTDQWHHTKDRGHLTSYWEWETPHHWIASRGYSGSPLKVIWRLEDCRVHLAAGTEQWALQMYRIVSGGSCCSLFCRAGYRTGGPDNLRGYLPRASHQECCDHCNLYLFVCFVHFSSSVTEVEAKEAKHSDKVLQVLMSKMPVLENESTNILCNQTS